MSLNTKYTKHVRRVQADLLMLAFVRVHLVALFGSMDEYRIQGALIEQLGLATNSTTNFVHIFGPDHKKDRLSKKRTA